MTAPIDISTLTPFAALVILGFLVFKYFTKQAEKKDEFTESIALRNMERSEKAEVRTQAIADGAIDAMNQHTETIAELTKAIKEGDDVTIKQICDIGDMQQTMIEAQIDHEDQAQKRHEELLVK